MGGFAVQYNSGGIESSPQRLLPTEMFDLFMSKTLDWPDVDDKEIEDRSKADWLVKATASSQVLWFVAQIIGRAIQGLAVR